MKTSQIQALLHNLFAGLIAGLATLIYSISFAALIFSGDLARFFPQGVGCALIGATVTAIIVAWRSGFPYALAGPESHSAIILAIMASEIANSMGSPAAAERLYPTVWAAIILSTVATGLFLFILGCLRFGYWARFVPYPVIGGFLAGTGWLIVRSSFKVMTGVPFGFAELSQLVQTATLVHWLAGLLFTAALFFALSHFKHFLILPGLVMGGVISFNSFWWLTNFWRTNMFFAKIDPEGWFFESFPPDRLWQAWQVSTFYQIDWSVLMHQIITLMALMLIVVISILLNATGLELATSSNADLDRELRANGIANLVNGFCGGIVGYLSVNRSLLNLQASANSPLAGIIAGTFCGMVLIFGSSFLSFFPKPILGGLLLYIGLTLLIRWVYRAWFQFPRGDYALILLILVVVATSGLLQGVSVGIAISCFLFIVNYGRNPVAKYTTSGAMHQSNVQRSSPQQKLLQEQGSCIYILVLQSFIFFGTANTLFEQICKRLGNRELLELKFIVFDFRLVNGLDSSVVLSFIKLKQLAQKQQLRLVFTQLQPSIEQQLQQGGLIETEDRICYLFCDLDRGIEWCENQILEENKLLSPEFVPLVLQLQVFLLDINLAFKLMHYLEKLQISEGEVLFQQGDSPNGLYFLESGQVSVVIALSNGQSKRLRTYNSGTILGEMGLYSKAPRSASIIADRLSYLYFLSTDAFERMEAENPQLAASFSKFIVNLLAERLRCCEEELKTLLQ